jgi:serine/threonine-protein kinase
LETFGAYEIVRELGLGSAARVYEARRGNQSVALKIFHPEKHYDDKQTILTQFRNEASAVRHLHHPNIVKVVETGIFEDRPYIAMELLAGGSLEARLRSDETMSVAEVMTILGPLCDALDYAHDQRVLHRDIKPSNILFRESNQPVLSDFGVARLLPPRDHHNTTQAGGYAPPGTMDFLAPEVLMEAPHSVASDIYALGMTVYIALSSTLPTDGRTLFTRSRDRVAGELVNLAMRNPNVPAPVADVVMRALSARPRDRFRSASDFAAAFRAATSGVVQQDRETGSTAPDHDLKSGRRLDYWRYVVVPLIVALIGAVAGWCSRG